MAVCATGAEGGECAPGLQPKPPSKLRQATTWATARGVLMAAVRSRMASVSSAQYENLHRTREPLNLPRRRGTRTVAVKAQKRSEATRGTANDA